MQRFRINQIKAVIIGNISESIGTRLTADIVGLSSHRILQITETHIPNKTRQKHILLESEAKSIFWLPGPELDKYTEQHKLVRTKMVNAPSGT